LREPCRALCHYRSIRENIDKAVAIIYLVGCFLVLSSLAWGQDQDASITAIYSDVYHNCDGATDALIDCTRTEEKKWHTRLDDAFQALKDASPPKTKRKLEEARNQWLVFKDKWCDASKQMGIQDGTGSDLVRADCTLALTARRAIELELALKALQYSLDGPKSSH
jgi:uncharacterized protein YecT (DUF1311 family)